MEPLKANWRRLLTPPNVVTAIRASLFWLPALMLVRHGIWEGFWRAVVAFAVLSLTDLIDGWLARRNNGQWRTRFGAIFDSVADKLIFTSYVAALCYRHWGNWPIWTALLLLVAREVWLAAAQAYHYWLYGRYVTTNVAGKVKTALLCLTSLALSVPYSPSWIYQLPVWGVLLVTIYSDAVSTIDYVRSFRAIRKEARNSGCEWQNQPTYLRQLAAGGWRLPASKFTMMRAMMSFWAMVALIVVGDTSKWGIAIAGVIAVAAVTDFLDGYVARLTGTVSRLGKWMDPVVDKFFIGFTYIGLAVVNRPLILAAALIILREVAVIYMQKVIEHKRGERVSSSLIGKSKMLLQCVAAILLCLPSPVALVAGTSFLVVSIILAYMSGAEYAIAFVRVMRP